MTRIVSATDARATLFALLDEVAAGEDVEITKRGRVVARLTATIGRRALRGSMASVAMTAVEDDELLSNGVRWTVE